MGEASSEDSVDFTVDAHQRKQGVFCDSFGLKVMFGNEKKMI